MTRRIGWLWIVLAAACTRPPPAAPRNADRLRLRVDASIAAMRDDVAACAAAYEQAAALDPRDAGDLYDAAACRARSNAADAAVRDLGLAIERGYHDVELMRADPRRSAAPGRCAQRDERRTAVTLAG